VGAANDISFKIGALVNDVAPVLRRRDIPLDQKKGILADYIKGLQPFQPEAQEKADRFLSLEPNVTAFKDSLKSTVEANKIEVDKGLEDIEKDFRELEGDLEKLSHTEARGWNTLKTILPFRNNVNEVQLAAIDALAKLAPTVGEKIMDIALHHLDSVLAEELKKRKQSLNDDLTHLKKILDDDPTHLKKAFIYNSKKKKDVEDLKTTSTKVFSDLQFMYQCERLDIKQGFFEVFQDVANLEPTFKGMCQMISKIPSIWLFLLNDTQELTTTLSKMKEDKETHNKDFDEYLTTLATTYEALKFSVDQYSQKLQLQSRR
jgi:demethoxyubiquinone hydroxylase (CLK1/Coq7/Cat5 family)